MARPVREIKCRKCKRRINAIIVKEYGLINKNDSNETIFYQQVIIKDHRRSFWSSQHCNNSGSKFRMIVGYANAQSR